MVAVPEIHAGRVLLRGWREDDLDPFSALCADPEVMRYFPATLTRDQCAAAMRRIDAHFEEHGFGMWALEVPGVAPFIGFVGLAVPRFELPSGSCVEIGWRIARAHWGHGHVTEAARAVLYRGFTVHGLDEVVSFTVPENLRSRAVMQRLGMRHFPEGSFDHPLVPEGHPLRRQVLYRLRREEFLSALPGGG